MGPDRKFLAVCKRPGKKNENEEIRQMDRERLQENQQMHIWELGKASAYTKYERPVHNKSDVTR